MLRWLYDDHKRFVMYTNTHVFIFYYGIDRCHMMLWYLRCFVRSGINIHNNSIVHGWSRCRYMYYFMTQKCKTRNA